MFKYINIYIFTGDLIVVWLDLFFFFWFNVWLELLVVIYYIKNKNCLM